MTTLLAVVALASPQFEHVSDCADLEPLRWENALYADRADGLFTQEAFLPETRWEAPEEDVTGNRLVADCFGEAAPHSRFVVVHHYPPAPLTPPRTRPVVLVSGAGDNALRSLSFIAVALSRSGFHSYAMTFAHRHGDNYQQAEQVANVVALASARHPGVKVDLVAYSKGAVAARVYTANVEGTDWPDQAYNQHGTTYRGDVGRLILLGAANAGLDTIFRWPSSNLLSLAEDPPDSPVSWTRYWGGGLPVDLSARNVSAAANFPGQQQLLADLREMYALPGGDLSYGAYANQPDYLTTYIGGAGFVSESLGIEHAIEAGGRMVEALQARGVDEGIDIYLGAGGNPILSVGSLEDSLYQTWWGDQSAGERRRTWEGLVDEALGQFFPWWGEAFEHDLPRLFAGTAFLGEISGPSDGLVFVESAMDDSGLTARGAEVVETRLFVALNHAELIAAGQLAADFYGDEETAGVLYDPELAAKYGQGENQVVEWVIGILEEPVPEVPPQPPEPDGGVAEPDGGGEEADAGAEEADAAVEEPEVDAGALVDAAADQGPIQRDGTALADSETKDPDGPGAGGGGGDRFGGSCGSCAAGEGAPGAMGWLLLLAIGCCRRTSGRSRAGASRGS